MKRILITGANSYIGTSFEKWMQQFGDDYQIDTIDMHGDSWREADFSVYDSVLHVAGIAHADIGKVSESEKKKYYSINRDLTFEVAKMYKMSRPKQDSQFIFMSSIIVYGDISNVRKKIIISDKTKPNPSNFYGDSKFQAEIALAKLKCENFKVTIIRPPMIYGENCKGNYLVLEKIASNFPVFPYFKNERSVLEIGNLCYFIKLYVDEYKSGVVYPQDENYKSTSYWVKDIGIMKSKNIKLLKGFSWLIYLLSFMPGKVGVLTKKAFGNLVYDRRME